MLAAFNITRSGLYAREVIGQFLLETLPLKGKLDYLSKCRQNYVILHLCFNFLKEKYFDVWLNKLIHAKILEMRSASPL